MRAITQPVNNENAKRTKTRPQFVWGIVFTLMLGVASSASAQQSAGVLLQSGLYKEDVNGDPEAAIEIYERVLKEFPKDRPIAAKALLHIGLCYEKLGKQEAQKAYQRLLKEYADQSDVVSEARIRLAGIRKDNGKREVTIRKVSDIRGGRPSPDGRYLVFCDWDAYGDLAIHDLVTGENRDLSHGVRDWDKRVYFADGYCWSPDGKQIAYAWLSDHDKPDKLCVVDIDGSEPRVLQSFEDKAVQDIVVHDWSQDGKFILAGFYKNIIKKTGPNLRLWDLALVSVADGSMRILKSIGPPVGRPSWQVSRSLSPDGRYIVYARSVEEDKGFRNIFVLATDDSGEEIPLVQHPADDCSPIWAPDGKTIVLSSDRSGTYDTWLIHVADGKPVGELQLVKKSTGSMIPMGFTREGSLYYRSLPNLVEGAPWTMGDIYTASLDPITGKILVPPKKAIQQFEGFNACAAWSPDGKRLAYISARAQPARGSARRRWALVIRSLETGQERELVIKPPTIAVGPCWSPDGRSIVCRNQLVKGMISPGHLSLIDAQTGDATPIVQRGPNTNGTTSSWVWSPHGKTVYYVIGQDGPARIMVHNLETGKDKEICGKVNRRTGLTISPDGRQLAFAGSERKSIMVVSVEGGEPRALLRLQGEEHISRMFTLAWTPDGHYILFGKGHRPTELWRVSVEGGEPQKLMETETLAHLGIHPDGRQIVFTAVPRREDGTWAIDNFLPKS